MRGGVDVLQPLGRRLVGACDAAGNQTQRLTCRGYRTACVYDADQNLTGHKYSSPGEYRL